MPDWDPNEAEPATKHLLMGLIELDQLIKEQNTRLEEVEVRLGVRRPPPHADEIDLSKKFDF